MREQFQRLDELDSRLVAALEAEGEDSTCAQRRIFLLQRIVLVARQAGIIHPRNLGMV